MKHLNVKSIINKWINDGRNRNEIKMVRLKKTRTQRNVKRMMIFLSRLQESPWFTDVRPKFIVTMLLLCKWLWSMWRTRSPHTITREKILTPKTEWINSRTEIESYVLGVCVFFCDRLYHHHLNCNHMFHQSQWRSSCTSAIPWTPHQWHFFDNRHDVEFTFLLVNATICNAMNIFVWSMITR